MAVGGAWVDLSTVDSDNERDYHRLSTAPWPQGIYGDSLCLNSRRLPVQGTVVPHLLVRRRNNPRTHPRRSDRACRISCVYLNKQFVLFSFEFSSSLLPRRDMYSAPGHGHAAIVRYFIGRNEIIYRVSFSSVDEMMVLFIHAFS
jgi:hypothetical protein